AEAQAGGGGPWAGAMQGVRISMAQEQVRTLMRRLTDTPPFLSNPVMVPYVAQRITVRKISRVSTTIKLTDAKTLQSQIEEVRAFHEQTGRSIRGAMPSDSALQNVEPRFANDADAVGASFVRLTAEVDDAVRRLGGLMWMARARSAAALRGSSAEILGSLLYARDALGPDAPELLPLRSLLTAAVSVTPDRLSATKLDLSTLVAPGTTSRSSAGSRSAVLDRILNSVVTIETERGTGSGFFVDGDGLILTNAHVVEAAGQIRIKNRAQEVFVGRVVQTSTATDLALLRIPTRAVRPLSLGSVGDGVVGTDVVAVGSPKGLQGTVTKGIVSAVRRMYGVTMLQVDAPINPGSSGGPLLTEEGVVLGVNTVKWTGDSVEGLGFAVAVDEARRAFGALLPPSSR